MKKIVSDFEEKQILGKVGKSASEILFELQNVEYGDLEKNCRLRNIRLNVEEILKDLERLQK